MQGARGPAREQQQPGASHLCFAEQPDCPARYGPGQTGWGSCATGSDTFNDLLNSVLAERAGTI
jgi:hypothetical protein